MTTKDIVPGVPAPVSVSTPENVDHSQLSYFGTVTFRSGIGKPLTCDAQEVIADIITDPGGGNARALSEQYGQTPSLTEAELEAIPGHTEYFTLLYQALQAKLVPPPPPEP